jgi:ABC-type polysaccharide transport system permease subunit
LGNSIFKWPKVKKKFLFFLFLIFFLIFSIKIPFQRAQALGSTAKIDWAVIENITLKSRKLRRYFRKTWYADIFLMPASVQKKIKIGEGQVEKSQSLSVLKVYGSFHLKSAMGWVMVPDLLDFFLFCTSTIVINNVIRKSGTMNPKIEKKNVWFQLEHPIFKKKT